MSKEIHNIQNLNDLYFALSLDIKQAEARISERVQLELDKLKTVKCFSVKDFARATGLTKATVQNYLYDGIIIGIQKVPGGRWSIPSQELDRFLANEQNSLTIKKIKKS